MTWTVPEMMDELGLRTDKNNQRVGSVLAREWKQRVGRPPDIRTVARQGNYTGPVLTEFRMYEYPDNWREFGVYVAVRVARGTYRSPRQGTYTGGLFGW